MRIVLSDFISLDGVVQAPGGAEEDTDGGFAHGGWSMPYFEAETMGPVLDRLLEQTDGLLFGRRTWQVMAGAWPERAGDRFADRMNALPKHVASRTLSEADMVWNSRLLPAEDTIGAIRDLRAQSGGTLQVMGSTSLARALVAHDLVDEYSLVVEPILLGGGKSVFPADGEARPLRLVDVQQAGTGALVCRYERDR